MRSFVFSTVVALLGACNGTTKTSTAETSTEPTPTDTGTGVTPPTPTPTDTGVTSPTEPIAPQDVTFVIDGEWAGTSLVVYAADLDSGVFGLQHAAAAVSAAIVPVTLPPPSPSALVPLDPSDPNTVAAFYLTGLIDDTDGDQVRDPGEVFVGASPVLLAYIDSPGGLAFQYKILGLRNGWNAFELDADTGLPVVASLDAIPVDAPAMVTSVSISGTFTGKGAPRIALVPGNQYDSFTDVLYDAPAGDWVMAIDGPPPASHLVVGNPDLPDGSALEIPASYDDLDESGSLTTGDAALDPACTPDQREVVLAWFPHTEDLFVTYLLGGRSGWMVVADPEGDFEIIGTTVTDLVIGPCGS